MSITWNGVNSDTIGVIVERIPNRYVPTRRFSPQQVAGRNGNILLVDKAFPNVEQEYEVYLSAEAQGLPSVARACAEWLMGPDGYCRLTDSYDTTVYREAFLMGGFDIENILNKFGRCTITFSCKPQKYLLTGDTPIEIPAGSTTTYTGSSVQFDGITGASITSLSTTITPTQDLHGYANPWPAGGGKNLCPPDIEQGGFTETGMNDNTSGIYTTRIRTEGYIPVTGGETITVSATGAAAYYTVSGYTADDYETARIQSSSWIALGSSCSIDSGVKYIRIAFRKSNNSNITPPEISDVMCEYGSSATSFAPYSNNCPISGRTGLSVYVSPTQDQQDATTYAVDWTSEAGTVYGGTLDVVTGVLTVDRAMVDMGTLNWSATGDRFAVSQKLVPNPVTKATWDASNPMAICSMYKYGNIGNGNGVDKAIGFYSGYLYARDTAYSTAADFKSAMSGVQLVYELATPLTYQLTPQEIEALVGTNNVWSSSGDVSVTVSTPLGGIVTNPTPFEARPMLEVSGVGEITINGKSIQILEAVSDFQIDCESMEAEDNSKIYCMDFPDLSGGENEIVGDGSITALTVTPRWWTL